MSKFLSQLVKLDFISVGKWGVILHNQVQKEENWVYPKDADEKFAVDYEDEFSDDASKNIVDPTRTIFFLENDLHPGTTMNYCLAGNFASTTPFLSRKIVEHIPLGSSKLQEILNNFSVKLC
ncbi:BURP domain-containing protein 3-like [Pyrus ussuriensis x Pyrus communis]|uniref:BURP domain-containing protein 3-like n=1 Tax=Pyrus ussuriensis x Pyrus communis TaxID=2448454 RepID=A0A5N5HLW7_9ROSA|nr:BURP domain-containing protein 3-like [Pyrus ussuriensis x Pyrus communis]